MSKKSKSEQSKNGTQQPSVAPQPVSRETVLAAQLHEARVRASALEADLANALSANAQLAAENARLTQIVARANAANTEADNERLRAEFGLPMGKALQRDAAGNYFWVEPGQGVQQPTAESAAPASQG